MASKERDSQAESGRVARVEKDKGNCRETERERERRILLQRQLGCGAARLVVHPIYQCPRAVRDATTVPRPSPSPSPSASRRPRPRPKAAVVGTARTKGAQRVLQGRERGSIAGSSVAWLSLVSSLGGKRDYQLFVGFVAVLTH